MISALDAAALANDPELAEALLRLNNDHAVELSLLEAAGLERLVAGAFVARRAGLADALLIVFDQNADYDSPNFLWFRDRYERFVYVDRVVTAVAVRGRGLAGQLYRDLVEQARAAGHQLIVCEVNSDPPNPGSAAFHRGFGFEPVGEARLPNGKTVSYLAYRIEAR
ncbi:MAG: GCN5-related N-acetyltransferase [Caulobacter sp.]|nr:GCN5-related N-acetyltransferase [Caulobacter sp.]